MYHTYFGLKDQVFSIAVDPHYLYMSSQHREALAHLLYGVNSGGFVLLTGEVGTGKTTIVRCLLEQLPAETELAIVLNPVASALELLCSICDEFRIDYKRDNPSVHELMDRLYHYLLANHRAGKNTVLLIDEAQLLRVSALEQVRLLTNLETNSRKLLQIILVGQPELNELLAKPSLRQLSQRITARYHLNALSLEETEAYISHRLHVAGMRKSDNPFPADVVKAVHSTSRGIPRLINVLCDRMLLGAYSQDKNRINRALWQQARREVLGEEHRHAKAAAAPSRPKRRRWNPWLTGSGWAAAAGIAALSAWQLWWPANTPPNSMLADATALAGPVLQPADTELIEENAIRGAGVVEVSFSEEGAAISRLLERAGAENPAGCDAGAFRCAREQMATWSEVRALDRPAVLRLVTPARHERFALVVGLGRDSALLQSPNGERVVPLSELGPLWTGELLYTWFAPEAFSEAVGVGAEGPIVSWIAQQFAQIDGQESPLAERRFNQQLAERVKIFQRQHALQADGVFGMRTLMALNQQLGRDPRLQQMPLPSANDALTDN